MISAKRWRWILDCLPQIGTVLWTGQNFNYYLFLLCHHETTLLVFWIRSLEGDCYCTFLNTVICDATTELWQFLMLMCLTYAPAVACPSTNCSFSEMWTPAEISDHAEYGFSESIIVCVCVCKGKYILIAMTATWAVFS